MKNKLSRISSELPINEAKSSDVEEILNFLKNLNLKIN